MRELVGKLEAVDQAVAELVVTWARLVPGEAFAQARHRALQRRDVEGHVRRAAAPVVFGHDPFLRRFPGFHRSSGSRPVVTPRASCGPGEGVTGAGRGRGP